MVFIEPKIYVHNKYRSHYYVFVCVTFKFSYTLVFASLLHLPQSPLYCVHMYSPTLRFALFYLYSISFTRPIKNFHIFFYCCKVPPPPNLSHISVIDPPPTPPSDLTGTGEGCYNTFLIYRFLMLTCHCKQNHYILYPTMHTVIWGKTGRGKKFKVIFKIFRQRFLEFFFQKKEHN